jgi:exodeoxyribonuclease-3
VHGQKTYNSVAIMPSRLHASGARLPGDGPGQQRRFAVAGITVVNVYVPMAARLDCRSMTSSSPGWLDCRAFRRACARPAVRRLHVAPDDRDVWDPELWRGKVLFSEPEKDALRRVVDWGLVDTLRQHHPEGGIYTWWDYRAGAFHRGWGVRIDHLFASRPLAERCRSVEVDREARKGPGPSDHAPVVVEFA